MENLNIKVTEVAFHRNGICGVGFYAVLFTATPNSGAPERFLATVFDEPGACAVIGLDRIESQGVKFAGGNSWRGDHFEPALRKAIKSTKGSGCERMGPFSVLTE